MPDTPNNNDFLKPKGDYKNLVAYKKAECIYDMTCFFVEHYLPKFGDRTVDQMVGRVNKISLKATKREPLQWKRQLS